MATTSPDDFAEALLDVCRRESVDIVIPGADEEVFALAKAKSAFLEAGVKCAVEDSEKVELTRDKVRFFERLAQADVPLPKFAEISTAGELHGVAEALGYPERPVILKPNTGRGARGLILVDSKVNALDQGTEARGYAVGNVDLVTELLGKSEEPLGLIAMEFLPGDIFDCDCVARDGVPLCIVPRRRLWDTPFSRGVEGHRIEHNPEMEGLVKQITEALSFNYVFDCDFGSSADGKPGLLELNPRWSGSVTAALAGGVNVPSVLVRSMADLPLPNVEVRAGATAIPMTRMVFPEWPAVTIDGLIGKG
jgi:carbamoyl-phosphate synthase large subunit